MVKSEQATDGQVYPSEYTYNLSGVLIEQKYPSGRVVKNVLDNSGDISMIQSKRNANFGFFNYAKNFEYTASGVIKHLQLGSGLWESAVMNSRNQVLQLKMGNSSTDASRMHLTYDYGEFDQNGNVDVTKNAGNIARQTITFNGLANPFVQNYKYDSLDRITEAKETVNGNQTWIQTFGYDRYGNRTSHSETVQGQAKPINESTMPTTDQNTNRFSNTTNYQYDAVGNLIRDASGRQFVFDGDNKQVEVKDSQNNVVGQYQYDGNGKRIKKITATEYVVFVYDGLGKLIGEYSTDVPPQNPMVHYTATDPLGSPRVLTNENGEIISRRDFMPFGEEIAPDTTYRTAALKYGVGDSVRQKFTGYERDEETGLDFAEARYYFNNHGRFTAVDPLLASGKSANPQTFNRYVYVLNNPLIYTDPTGLQAGKKAKPKTEQTQPTDIPKKGYYIDFTGGGAKLTGQEVTSGGKNFGPQYGAVFLINPIVYKDGKVVKADNVTISETVEQGPITVNGPNGTRVPASNDLKDAIKGEDSVGEKLKTSAPEGIQDIRGLTASTQEDSDYQRSIGLETTVTATFNVEVDNKLVVSRSITTTSSADVVKVSVGPNVPAPVAKPPVVRKPKKGPNEEGE